MATFFKTLQFTWMEICKTWYSRLGGREEPFGDSYDQGREKSRGEKRLTGTAKSLSLLHGQERYTYAGCDTNSS